MSRSDDAATIGLVTLVERCVQVGGDPHASAMVGFYFGARCEQIAPDFASALRLAFDRAFQVSSATPAELVEEKFRSAIEEMASVWRSYSRVV